MVFILFIFFFGRRERIKECGTTTPWLESRTVLAQTIIILSCSNKCRRIRLDWSLRSTRFRTVEDHQQEL
jgi:hypothetical protein